MKKLVVWICNGVVALLAILAIVGYFFAPFWKIKVSYTLESAQLEDMFGELTKEFDVEEILGDEGITLALSLKIDTSIVFGSFGSDAEKTVSALVESNVDSLVDQVSEMLKSFAPKAAESVAKKTVRDEVRQQVQRYLESIDSQSTESIDERLKAAGIDKAIDEKIDSVIGTLFEGSAKKEEVREEVLSAVDDIYATFQTCSDEELKNLTLSDENRASIEKSVDELLTQFANEDGVIDLEAFLDELLTQAMEGLENGDSGSTGGIVPLAAQSSSEDSSAKLKETVKDFIMSEFPSEMNPYIIWVLRVMFILYLFSSFWWVFILIKLLVIFLKKMEPTVKLKAPIWLGSIPFFLFVLLPSIALAVGKGILAGVIPELAETLGAISITFASSGWIAFFAGCVCIPISIFYIVLRKKAKKEKAAQDGSDDNGLEKEVAASEA